MRFLLSSIIIFLSCYGSLYAENRHILILQSYNKGLVWSDNISKGIEDTLLLQQDHYEITTEYMDTKKINSKEYMNSLYKLFVLKMENQTFDAIIVADNEAVEFVLKYRNELFKNIPLVFCGIDKRDPGLDINIILNKNIPLILESKEIKVNMNFIAKTLPNLEQLYIINDYTGASVLVNHTYRNEGKKLEEKGIKVTLNLNGNLEQIKKDIKNLPKNSAVLFGSLFRDKEGRYIPYYDVNDVLNSSKVPLFSMSDSHFGKGVIGGYLLRGYDLGVESAKQVIRILQTNKKLKYNPIIVPSKWSFDCKAMEKYNINMNKIPKDAIIINLPKTFFEKHKKLVEYAFIIFPFLLISLIFAIINNYQKYKLSQKLKGQSELQEVLLNNIQNSIFWIDNQFKIKGCNNSFCKLLNLKQEEIIGKDICKVFFNLCNLQIKNNLKSLEEIEFTSDEKIFRLTSQMFLNNKGENGGVVSIITNITEKRQLEVNTQFIIQQSKLSEVGEMLSAIVHQWKNPLVELSAIAHKMMYYDKKNKLTSDDIKIFYDNIMTQTIYMSDTIDGFRDFIRPSNMPKAFNVDTGLQEVLTLLSHSLKYSHIELNYENKSKEYCFAYGYPNEFKQVVVSIINNAKDAINSAKKSNTSLKGLIKLSLYKYTDNIQLYIEDNGCGIKDEIIKQLFNPFFTTKSKGDGFGLYMAKLIIENKMHGKIKVSQILNGTRVSISIPISESIK
ncbi:histidine kinase [Malaciobacter molluscorum]|uniref:ATP-binding protein n=1 Tax=Malaciobacter molluscorum TaxID=1032072 RepID=UPI00100BC172|nr:ATP-binding protein [Malaciobacter molluscorum]RXJ93780.1 histidine kinase [Malaciobacter molluscorum]